MIKRFYNADSKLPVGTVVTNLSLWCDRQPENRYEYWFIPGTSIVLGVQEGNARYENVYILEVENPPQELADCKESLAIKAMCR